MSTHVLLNLLNKLRKRNKMLGNYLLAFPQEFNKFNYTGAWMLESIHHMTLKSKRESSNFPNFLNLKFAVCNFFLIVQVLMFNCLQIS